MSPGPVVRTWEIGPERREEFVALGRRPSRFFPHATLHLPKPGPDGYKLALRMCGAPAPGALWEIVLHAAPPVVAEFPPELFFDRDLVWHEQHFGRVGQIATADVVLAGPDLWSMAHVADVVQRIGRRREHKTRIEKRFKGWHDMLLNALLAFAVERGARRILLPTSGLAMENTDPKRTVEAELFERTYDRDVARLYHVTRAGRWWELDVAANRDRLVEPRPRETPLEERRVVCVCHDVEAGLGHRGIDEALAARADAAWRERVAAMLEVERAAGVRATYNVVGSLLGAVREEIERDGHCLAFHSFDHAIDREPGAPPQLERCRRLDYRLKGYRPPQSVITPELSDENLLFHNFEWIASSTRSLGVDQPVLRDGLVRIPVHLDDHRLHRDGLDFDRWEQEALAAVENGGVTVLSLHDCYADLWLERYPAFLRRLGSLAALRTLDEVAAEVTLRAAA